MKVLAALDMESGTDTVLRFAADLVQQTGGSLLAVHVVTKDEQDERVHTPGDSGFVDVMVEDTARDLTARLLEMGLEQSAIETMARTGSFVEMVRRLADDADATVIVVGMRRRSRVGKFLLGSDLQDLLLATDRPVVTVPIERDPEVESPSG